MQIYYRSIHHKYKNMGLSKEDQHLLDKVINQILVDTRIIGVLHFGSSTNKKFYKDIDIALISNGIFTSEEKIHLFSKIPEKIDVSFLEDLPLYIARHAIEGNLIINKDNDKVFDVIVQILQKWEDFRPMWELYIGCVYKWLWKK